MDCIGEYYKGYQGGYLEFRLWLKWGRFLGGADGLELNGPYRKCTCRGLYGMIGGPLWGCLRWNGRMPRGEFRVVFAGLHETILTDRGGVVTIHPKP